MTTWVSTTTTATTTPANWTITMSPEFAYPMWAEPKREPERPLTWLDREIERTCALARSS